MCPLLQFSFFTSGAHSMSHTAVNSVTSKFRLVFSCFSSAARSPSTSALTAATHCTAARAFARTSLIFLRREQFQLREPRTCWRMQLKAEFKIVARSKGSAWRCETETKMRAVTSERNSCVTVCGQARTQQRRGSTTRRRTKRRSRASSCGFRMSWWHPWSALLRMTCCKALSTWIRSRVNAWRTAQGARVVVSSLWGSGEMGVCATGIVPSFIFYVLRRRRRGSVPTVAHHQHWNVNDLKKSTHTAEERGNHSFQSWPTLIRKVVHAILSTFQTIHTTRRHQKKGRNTLVPEALYHNSKETDEPAQLKRARRSRSFFLFFSHHIPLLLLSQTVHGERKASICCDS